MLQTPKNISTAAHTSTLSAFTEQHWKISDLKFENINLTKVRQNENLFYLATCASFVESGSDIYTQNLVDFFDGDPEIAHWLRSHWEPEELQHGCALRCYVEHVWPEFDWQKAYDRFLEEYSNYCKVELLEPTKALEMVSRCVVETGTATFYKAVARSTDEPVLKDLASRIARDEVGHYKHFLQYFNDFRDRENLGRTRILRTLHKRTFEMRSEDADCAIRHAIAVRSPHLAHDKAAIKRITTTMHHAVRKNVQPEMTIKMILRPLALPKRLQDIVAVPVTYMMNHLFFR